MELWNGTVFNDTSLHLAMGSPKLNATINAKEIQLLIFQAKDAILEREFAKGRSKSQVKIRALCEGAHYSGESSQVSDGQTD